MRLLNLFKAKKPKQITYEDRINRLLAIGCTPETVSTIRERQTTCNAIDCAIIFAMVNPSLKNDAGKLNMLIDSAYRNALGDKEKRSVQYHALQICEAFKKL